MKLDNIPALEGPLHIRDLYPGDFFSLDSHWEVDLYLRLLIHRNESHYSFLRNDGSYEKISMATADYFGYRWYRV